MCFYYAFNTSTSILQQSYGHTHYKYQQKAVQKISTCDHNKKKGGLRSQMMMMMRRLGSSPFCSALNRGSADGSMSPPTPFFSKACLLTITIFMPDYCHYQQSISALLDLNRIQEYSTFGNFWSII